MALFGRKKRTIGLDVGSGLVKVAVVEHAASGPELVRVALMPVLPDAIVEGEVMDGGIVSDAITAALQAAGVSGPRVVAAVGGRDVIVKKIQATQQSLLGITEAGPSITERTATNEVLVADGETAVIAGLTQTQVTKVVSGIPLLSKLPWVGRFFRQEREEQRKQDLLILVTPHIVDEGEAVRPPTL
jgi:Flp pilus assembly secretin CpaC